MNVEPDATTSGPAPMSARRRGARRAPATPSGTAIEDAERDRLHGRPRRPLAVALADPPRDHRGRGDREADRERVEDREDRLREADRRDGRGAELADTQKTSTTAKTDSSAISRTIGIARRTTARPTGPSV